MRRAVFALIIIFTISACRKGSTYFHQPSIIDDRAACDWFPVSTKTIYNYNIYVPESDERPVVKAMVTDSNLSIGDFVIGHDSCHRINISYRDMHQIPFILNTDHSDSILASGKTATLLYLSRQTGNTSTVTAQGRQFTFRESNLYFTDVATGADSLITIKYIDDTGVYEISKMRLSASGTKNFMELTLVL